MDRVAELEQEVEQLKRYIRFLENQLNEDAPKWQKLTIAQQEAMSLMDDVEDLKQKIKKLRGEKNV